MEKLSADDFALIDDLFKTVFRDLIEEEQKIKAEHPEEWEKCKRDYEEFWAVAMPIIRNDPSFLARRYYGKRKGEDVDNGKIHPET